MSLEKFKLTKKCFYSFIILSIIVLIPVIAFRYLNRSSPAFITSIEDSKTIQDDLNGDGKKDILYVKKDEKNYYVQVNLNDGTSYGLNPSGAMPTLGDSTDYWPMKVITLDASRNNIKEIFLQSSFHGKPVQHIFYWKDKKYEDIYCSNNNILGFVDSKNNRTPRIISANIFNGEISYNSFIFVKDELKKYNYTFPSNYMGIDVISNFVTLLQSFPNDSLTLPSYFYHNISGSDLNLLYGTANNNTSYSFQDGVFKDLSWDSNGIPQEIKWTLNFKATSLSDNKVVKSIAFDLILTKYPNSDSSYNYKITSLNLR